MAVNTMTFNQLATVLAEITAQASGKTVIAPVNTNEFVSVAQTALLTGYDPLATAISQVLSRTIFSIRPYYRKFSGLYVNQEVYGNHVRKLTAIDKDPEDDSRLALVEGESIDQYKVCKPHVLQTNFYGYNQYEYCRTIYRDQLDSAFSGPDEFGRFITLIMQNVTDRIEQDHEGTARMTIANFMGGKIAGDTPNVMHLVTMYNDYAGTTFTTDTIKQPDNFKPFIEWLFSYLNTLSSMMEERSYKYHMNVTGQEVQRHTPRRYQKLYLTNSVMNSVTAQVLANTFHDNFLNVGDYETVNFWQSIDSPDGISVKPTYMGPSGNLVTPSENVVQSDIFGILFDAEAMGITTASTWSSPTPFNAKGGYYNMYWHYTDRYWNDFTENGVVMLLD